MQACLSRCESQSQTSETAAESERRVGSTAAGGLEQRPQCSILARFGVAVRVNPRCSPRADERSVRRSSLAQSWQIAVAFVTLGWVGIVAAQAPPAPFADTIEQRMQACTGCHGERGGGVRGAAFPRLAGQPVAYLVAQMQAFRDGVRTYAPMNFLMARQRDAYFVEMAGYFSAQAPDPSVVAARSAAPLDRAAFDEGRRIVHDGRPDAGLPACAACHGAALGGTLPAIPALSGLPRDFLIEQVGSWKTGAHRSPEPNCMAEVAKRMSGADIVAAATWLSLQPPTAAAVARDGPLPLACGTR